jgi:hypothetical protein
MCVWTKYGGIVFQNHNTKLRLVLILDLPLLLLRRYMFIELFFCAVVTHTLILSLVIKDIWGHYWDKTNCALHWISS